MSQPPGVPLIGPGPPPIGPDDQAATAGAGVGEGVLTADTSAARGTAEIEATGPALVTALRDILRITFVEPVREGRPQPSQWPPGLAAIGAAAMTVYVLLAIAATFAVPLRQTGDLTISSTSEFTLPTISLPLLVTGLLLSLSLAHSAALHTSWWLRLPLFLFGAAATFFFTSTAFDRPLLILGSVLAYLGLLAFTILRARRHHAWWEFVVVTALVATATLLPWAGAGLATNFIDPRPTGLEGALINLQTLALPAMIVAATAPAQIVVTGAVAASTREVGRRAFWVGAAVVLGWFGLSLYWAADGLAPSDLLSSAITLALVAAGLAIALRRAGRTRPEPPAVYPETWGPWLYPLATAMVAMIVVVVPLAMLHSLVPLLGLAQTPVGQLVDLAMSGWMSSNPGVLWRALLGVVALGFAWQRSRTNRLGEAGFLISFAVAVLLDAAGLLPGGDFLLDRTPAGYALVAGVGALGFGVWTAARRQLTRERAAGVLTVLLLAVLYPHRDLLSDPAGAVLVFSAPLVILFGLTWRILTDAGFTRTGSRHFPQPTRVLLFLANSLFAVTSIAFLALTRGTGTTVDTTIWTSTADSLLGDPLFVVALVAGTWLVAGRGRTGRISSRTSGPRPSA